MARRGSWNVIRDWVRVVQDAGAARRTEGRRAVRFGVGAVLSALLSVPCLSAVLLFRYIGHVGIFTMIFLFAVGVGVGCVCTALLGITSLVYWFCQLSVNRRAWTWISLVLVLAICGVGWTCILTLL